MKKFFSILLILAFIFNIVYTQPALAATDLSKTTYFQMVPILLLHCLLMRPLPVPQQKVHLKPIRLIVPAAVNYILSLLPLLSKSTAAPV